MRSDGSVRRGPAAHRESSWGDWTALVFLEQVVKVLTSLCFSQLEQWVRKEATWISHEFVKKQFYVCVFWYTAACFCWDTGLVPSLSQELFHNFLCDFLQLPKVLDNFKGRWQTQRSLMRDQGQIIWAGFALWAQPCHWQQTVGKLASK